MPASRTCSSISLDATCANERPPDGPFAAEFSLGADARAAAALLPRARRDLLDLRVPARALDRARDRLSQSPTRAGAHRRGIPGARDEAARRADPRPPA